MYNICVFIRACQTYLLLKETVYQNRLADNTCVELDVDYKKQISIYKVCFWTIKKRWKDHKVGYHKE